MNFMPRRINIRATKRLKEKFREFLEGKKFKAPFFKRARELFRVLDSLERKGYVLSVGKLEAAKDEIMEEILAMQEVMKKGLEERVLMLGAFDNPILKKQADEIAIGAFWITEKMSRLGIEASKIEELSTILKIRELLLSEDLEEFSQGAKLLTEYFKKKRREFEKDRKELIDERKKAMEELRKLGLPTTYDEAVQWMRHYENALKEVRKFCEKNNIMMPRDFSKRVELENAIYNAASMLMRLKVAEEQNKPYAERRKMEDLYWEKLKELANLAKKLGCIGK